MNDIFGQPIDLAKNSRCYYEAPKSAVAEFAQRPLYLMTPGAHKEATSGQIHAINNLFLIKGWSATCAIKKILQDLEDIRG